MPSSHYRKRLGQHFLNSRRLAERIVDFAGVADETVVEIGAGKGLLTELIAGQARHVFAVEIDQHLIQFLRNRNLPNVTIINQDFLKISLKDFPYPVVVGNIPYSITTPILETLTRQKSDFKKAVLTLQREYGTRILGRVGTRQYGAITIFLNYHFLVKKGFIIPERYFSPRPMVSSVVVALTKKEPPFLIEDEEEFFRLVRGIFRYRRKTLKNAILNDLDVSTRKVKKDLLQKRPEDLTIADFYYLYNTLRADAKRPYLY